MDKDTEYGYLAKANMRHTAISKLLGTTVGVKIKNTTVVGLLVDIAWDKDFQISELSLSPSENNVNTYLINPHTIPCFDEHMNMIVFTAL